MIDAAKITVRDIMTKSVIAVDSTVTVNEAAKLMDEKDIGCIIVTKNQLPVGILTERDFVKRIAAKEKPLSTVIEEDIRKMYHESVIKVYKQYSPYN